VKAILLIIIMVWLYPLNNELVFTGVGIELNGERSFFWGETYLRPKVFFFTHPRWFYVLWGICDEDLGYGVIFDMNIPKVMVSG